MKLFCMYYTDIISKLIHIKVFITWTGTDANGN